MPYCTFPVCSQRTLSIDLWLLRCGNEASCFLFQMFLMKRKEKKKISCIVPYSSVTDNWFHNLVARRRCSWLFGIFGMETRSSVACCNAVVNHMLKTLLTTCSGFQLIQPKLFIINSTNISKQINSNIRKLTTVLNKLLEIIVTLLVIDAIALVPTVSQAPC